MDRASVVREERARHPSGEVFLPWQLVQLTTELFQPDDNILQF
jgi:hypothetical protein